MKTRPVYVLRQGCDSVFALVHPAAERDVSLPHPSCATCPTTSLGPRWLSGIDPAENPPFFLGLLINQLSSQTCLPPDIGGTR